MKGNHGKAATVRQAEAAGAPRIRPALTTALAMIVGMVPMPLGNTRNAALGLAAIDGLGVATFSTPLFVPHLSEDPAPRRHAARGGGNGGPGSAGTVG